MRELAASAPGRLHSHATPSASWMFLNVRRRPFDAPDARRAVSLATDRARMVALAGGPEVGTPSCQVLPAAFPGFEPYCPYTAHPSRGGGWTAPDVERARRLLARSGRAGERVVVQVPDFQAPVGRYFVDLLDDLGLRASLRIHGGNYFPYIHTHPSRVQIGFNGWAVDYLTPASFIAPNFACRGPAERDTANGSQLCDPQLEKLVDRALAAPAAEAGPTWAAADRRVSDLAAAVPLTNRRMVVLVSRRVGNVQHHPAWLTLLDQMWVR
jgi:peptide/nickel transport system substrate-binding protein